MLRIFFCILFVLNSYHTVLSQTIFPSYYQSNNMELSTPGTLIYGLGGYYNPAELSYQPGPNILFTWSDQKSDVNDLSNWGLFTSISNLGFGIKNQARDNFSVTDYKLSGAIGSDIFSAGLGYGWSSGDVISFNRASVFTLGSIYRPANFISFSFIANLPSHGENEGIIGAGIRPLLNYNLTLFGDYTFTRDKIDEKVKWSAGAVVEPIDGLRLIGRYFDGKTFNAGIQLGLGAIGLTSISHFDSDSKYSYNTYGIRVGANDRNIFDLLKGKNNFAQLELLGGLKYQNFKLFDNSKTLLSVIDQLDAVKNDRTIAGIALNLSGMNINKEMLWELREKLKEIKSCGKKIYIYIDRAGIQQYHLASVADKIVLDPMGTISLEGFLMGRTFYKGTLDMLGIGFRELRYFKYKSADENYAREDFSEGDREQRQKYIDENYKLVQKDICEGRNFTAKYFDSIVDSSFLFLPDESISLKLADTLARWDEISNVINKFENLEQNIVNINSIYKFSRPDDEWGPKQKIAVIYAIGGTSLDDGIKARSLVKYLEAAINSPNIKAIVLRVDSPGGDALASDYIAETLRKNKGKKPVIVSQGYVAASGGYWLSMFADTIVAAPNTITGSIGVIGSYAFNKTFKQEIGLSTDFVKIGKFADLGFGATIPFVGIMLPDRDLNENELNKIEVGIKTLYRGFVNKVAAGRNKSFDEIEKIAQGRIWAGSDGLQNGLVDVLGGLSDAIKIAEQKSGLYNQDYEIVEMPEPEWFDFNSLMPSLFKIEEKVTEDPFIRDLKFRLQNNGIPMPILPIEFIDADMIYNEQ